MVEKSESQTVPKPSCFKTNMLYAAILIPSLAFTCLLCHKSTPLLTTIPILILSTILIAKFKKTKRFCLVQNQVQENQTSDPTNQIKEKHSKSISESVTNGPSSKLSIFDCEDDDDGEEGLIEIPLVGLIEEQKKRGHQSTFLGGSVFRQEELMELLEDINGGNEEERLIEIDISMGSIKRPRIEIEAPN